VPNVREAERQNPDEVEAERQNPDEVEAEPQSPAEGDTGKLTRRRFVAGTLATGASVALPAAADARTKHKHKHKPKHKRKPTSTPHRADVVVVGAGFAGLRAAQLVHRAGRSVIVLEARERVGGRVWNHDLGGGEVSERGGTFVGPTQDHVLGLMGELGIGKFPTYDSGDDVYIADNTRLTYSDTGATGTAPPDPTIVADLALTVSSLDSLSTQVPVGAPWRASNAAELDGQTLQSWLEANTITPRFRELAATACRPIFGAEPRELSLLFVLFYIASSGNEQNPGTFERNFDTQNGAQMWRVDGGSQSIALAIAKQLGKRVILGSPVRRIEQGSSGLTVVSDRVTIKAKQAIVAVPPTLAGRIDYEPILTFQRDQLTQRFGQGTLTKVAAVYDKPFWRDQGLSGTGITTGGPVSATFDDSPQDGSRGVIFGFVGGDWARSYALMSPGARQQAVIAQYASFFGSKASSPIDYFDTSWSGEQWTRGCPVGIPSLGALYAYGAWLRAPVGRIHWAGTETSTYWNGYMDGAVRSGERAATEVLAEL
jgi:monoamine oxidase